MRAGRFRPGLLLRFSFGMYYLGGEKIISLAKGLKEKKKKKLWN